MTKFAGILYPECLAPVEFIDYTHVVSNRLTGMDDFRRAVPVLLYADALKPSAPLILVDLGWAFYNMGDLAGARLFFEKAVKVSPDFAAAQLGLGLSAECQGNHASRSHTCARRWPVSFRRSA